MNCIQRYEPVIGMEIHAELHTQSKMFCGCAVTDTTVAEPNTTICPVCTGLPGAMPAVNREAVAQAMMVGLALNCQINEFTNFARKNYFYPDLPKGYQISQYDFPIATNGWVDVTDENSAAHHIRVRRAHMEEDTAKLFHIYEPGGADYTLIDFNRCGIPLLEIVSEPDMHSVEAVQAYATKIRETLRYLGVNSGDMEKGVLRFEANVSVRPRGSDTLGTRTEIKNLNSFRALTLATAYEIERQIAILEAGGGVVQETLGWDALRNATFSQRGKEHAHDYRYFPEPDLPPLRIERAWVNEVAAILPELPDAKHARFVADYGLTPQDARILVGDRAVAGYFESALHAYTGAPSSVAKWLIGELFYLMNRDNVSIEAAQVRPAALARLIGLVDAGTLNPNSAKAVLGEMFATGGQPEAIVEAKGLAQISDDERLAAVVAQVLADNAAQVVAYRAGKDSVFQWLMGQVMRATRGRAAPDVVRRLLSAALASIDDSSEGRDRIKSQAQAL